MQLRVLFRCGHQGIVKDGQEPLCVCGERRVVRALDTHKLTPRIVGTASGPHVQTKFMDPATPSIGESRLRLKPLEQTDADAR